MGRKYSKDIIAKMAAKKLEKSTQVKKKSKFQERLEAMQKMQQERLKKK
jgi:hypothetical protein